MPLGVPEILRQGTDVTVVTYGPNFVLFLDEDVEGGSTGYMMQQVLEVQNGYRWLDSAPKTLSAKDHRPAYI